MKIISQTQVIFVFLIGVTGLPSNMIANLKPNAEYVFGFDSRDLLETVTNHFQIRTPKLNVEIKLKAKIDLQVFSDSTYRVRMSNIQFYTYAGPASIQTAYNILESNQAKFGTPNHGVDEFKNFLEEPLMISVKRGQFKKITVSMDEPESVTNIKKSLMAELQTIDSSLRLQFINKKPISSILQISSKPKQIKL